MFEGSFHENADAGIVRYYDDGRKTVRRIGWSSHDEGDTAPDAATTSSASFGHNIFISAKEAAELMKMDVDKVTPEAFKQLYTDTWIKKHTKEAAENNPNPKAELKVIEEVMENAKKPTDEIVTISDKLRNMKG